MNTSASHKGKCVVVTFVWRDLTQKEKAFLSNNILTLQKHPFVIMHPRSYDVSYLVGLRPNLSELALEDKWFKSVATYNQLLKSPWFYELFQDYQYMLICQTDAYVFTDQVDRWCQLGYDYVGAPWLPNPTLYEQTLGFFVHTVMKRLPVRQHKVHSYHLFREVGNGGFSLRRVATMIDILRRNQSLVAIASGKHAQQEDVFISFLLGRKEHLRKPSWEQALYFSFEKAPDWSIKQTYGTLPFGCHDTNARNWENFWKSRIPLRNPFQL